MKVKVGSVHYKVKIKDDLHVRTHCLGEVYYASAEIFIEKNQSEDRKVDVLMHELLHAVFYEAGFDRQEEDTINRVAKVLTQMLRDNPKLLITLREGTL